MATFGKSQMTSNVYIASSGDIIFRIYFNLKSAFESQAAHIEEFDAHGWPTNKRWKYVTFADDPRKGYYTEDQ